MKNINEKNKQKIWNVALATNWNKLMYKND